MSDSDSLSVRARAVFCCCFASCIHSESFPYARSSIVVECAVSQWIVEPLRQCLFSWKITALHQTVYSKAGVVNVVSVYDGWRCCTAERAQSKDPWEKHHCIASLNPATYWCSILDKCAPVLILSPEGSCIVLSSGAHRKGLEWIHILSAQLFILAWGVSQNWRFTAEHSVPIHCNQLQFKWLMKLNCFFMTRTKLNYFLRAFSYEKKWLAFILSMDFGVV